MEKEKDTRQGSADNREGQSDANRNDQGGGR